MRSADSYEILAVAAFLLPAALRAQRAGIASGTSSIWARRSGRYDVDSGFSEQVEDANDVGAQGVTINHRTYARLGHEHPTDVAVLCWTCDRRGLARRLHGPVTPGVETYVRNGKRLWVEWTS
ncbi:MAG: hypothetical protein JO342_05335 [Solirubrobacterales bacterium]|nr:hypothetical protein [Solirubrobacterales bacterium]